MNNDEYRALVAAGPTVVMVAKADMLKLLDEHQCWKRWGRIYWWMIMIFSVLTLLEKAAKSGFWGAGQ